MSEQFLGYSDSDDESVEGDRGGIEFSGEMGEREGGDTSFSGEFGEREHEGRENESRESVPDVPID